MEKQYKAFLTIALLSSYHKSTGVTYSITMRWKDIRNRYYWLGFSTYVPRCRLGLNQEFILSFYSCVNRTFEFDKAPGKLKDLFRACVDSETQVRFAQIVLGGDHDEITKIFYRELLNALI